MRRYAFAVLGQNALVGSHPVGHAADDSLDLHVEFLVGIRTGLVLIVDEEVLEDLQAALLAGVGEGRFGSRVADGAGVAREGRLEPVRRGLCHGVAHAVGQILDGQALAALQLEGLADAVGEDDAHACLVGAAGLAEVLVQRHLEGEFLVLILSQRAGDRLADLQFARLAGVLKGRGLCGSAADLGGIGAVRLVGVLIVGGGGEVVVHSLNHLPARALGDAGQGDGLAAVQVNGRLAVHEGVAAIGAAQLLGCSVGRVGQFHREGEVLILVGGNAADDGLADLQVAQLAGVGEGHHRGLSVGDGAVVPRRAHRLDHAVYIFLGHGVTDASGQAGGCLALAILQGEGGSRLCTLFVRREGHTIVGAADIAVQHHGEAVVAGLVRIHLRYHALLDDQAALDVAVGHLRLGGGGHRDGAGLADPGLAEAVGVGLSHGIGRAGGQAIDLDGLAMLQFDTAEGQAVSAQGQADVLAADLAGEAAGQLLVEGNGEVEFLVLVRRGLADDLLGQGQRAGLAGVDEGRGRGRGVVGAFLDHAADLQRIRGEAVGGRLNHGVADAHGQGDHFQLAAAGHGDMGAAVLDLQHLLAVDCLDALARHRANRVDLKVGGDGLVEHDGVAEHHILVFSRRALDRLADDQVGVGAGVGRNRLRRRRVAGLSLAVCVLHGVGSAGVQQLGHFIVDVRRDALQHQGLAAHDVEVRAVRAVEVAAGDIGGQVAAVALGISRAAVNQVI